MDAILHRRPSTPWERYVSSPALFLARMLYAGGKSPECDLSSPEDGSKIRVVCISDTHNTHASQPPLPPGDILIHSGDLTNSGTRQELNDVLFWLAAQPHQVKVFIAGNHDKCLSPGPEDGTDIQAYIANVYPSLTYLCDSSTEVVIRGRSLRLYGSPWTPKHGNWVFQYPRIPPRLPFQSSIDGPTFYDSGAAIWSRIPTMTDVLVTHGPPTVRTS
jgi:predicted MPP superfamily phosphohydrolase